MNKQQAEYIINEYGGAISRDGNVFKRQSLLPCSKAKIRYAFFVYIPAILEQRGHLPKDIGDNLVACYSMLDAFVPDEDAQRLNKVADKIKKKELVGDNQADHKVMEEYFSLASKAIRNGDYFDEINQYINECYNEKGIKC